MNTAHADEKDRYNAAIAATLRAEKAELRATFPSLEAATGIKLRKLKALLNDEVSIRMGDFIRLTTALDLDPAVVITEAAARVNVESRQLAVRA